MKVPNSTTNPFTKNTSTDPIDSKDKPQQSRINKIKKFVFNVFKGLGIVFAIAASLFTVLLNKNFRTMTTDFFSLKKGNIVVAKPEAPAIPAKPTAPAKPTKPEVPAKQESFLDEIGLE